MPHVSTLVKKYDAKIENYDAKIEDFEKKYFTTSDCSKLKNDILDAKAKD